MSEDDVHERSTVPPLASEYEGTSLDQERELLKSGDERALLVLLFGKLDRVVMQFGQRVAERDELRDQDAARRDLELTKALEHNAEELAGLIGKVDGSMAGLNNLTTQVQGLVVHRDRSDKRLDELTTRTNALEAQLKEVKRELRSIRNGRRSGPPSKPT